MARMHSATLHDRIRWEGDAVAYHRIDTYRRDQSAQPGAIPTSYDRQSWQVAVGLREASAVHGDMKFVKEWDATDPAWSLQGEDLRLGPESPASRIGRRACNASRRLLLRNRPESRPSRVEAIAARPGPRSVLPIERSGRSAKIAARLRATAP